MTFMQIGAYPIGLIATPNLHVNQLLMKYLLH